MLLTTAVYGAVALTGVVMPYAYARDDWSMLRLFHGLTLDDELQRFRLAAATVQVHAMAKEVCPSVAQEDIAVMMSSDLSAFSSRALFSSQSLLAVPRSHLWSSTDDVVASGLTFNGDTPIEELAPLLLPSRERQRFTIAHELEHIHQHDQSFLCAVYIATSLTSYHLARRIWRSPGLSTLSRTGRAAIAAIAATFIMTGNVVCAHRSELQADLAGARVSAAGAYESLRSRQSLDRLSNCHDTPTRSHPSIVRRLRNLQEHGFTNNEESKHCI